VFMPLEDRAEISDLLARYGFALDLRRWDELRDVFTEDAGIHYSGTTEHTGIDDIVTFFRVTASSVAATQHLMHTSRVWPTGPDTAEGLTHITMRHMACRGRCPRSPPSPSPVPTPTCSPVPAADGASGTAGSPCTPNPGTRASSSCTRNGRRGR
jgi:hypothetical protein